MIKIIDNTEEAIEFALKFQGDRTFSDPMLSNEEQFKNNLCKSICNPKEHCTFGVYRENIMTGLFSFLALADEKYLEMLVGLSREKEAYDEMMEYLEEHYPSFQADFVYNPKNYLMTELLTAHSAEFETEQLKMCLREVPEFADNPAIIPYFDRYKEEYIRLHEREEEGHYWTAEKVIEAADRFRIFLALADGHVAGYIDMTYCFEENEPYDLYVAKEYRRNGYGRALLMKAIEANASKKMMLLVDIDNVPAIHLYQSMGFVKDESGGNLTAHMQIGKRQEENLLNAD